MIRAYQGTSVQCNLCNASGPIVRYDQARYRHVPGQPNHPNEYYITQINRSAEKQALEEGFVALKNPIPEVIEGEEPFQINQAQANERHICPTCLTDWKQSIIKTSKKRKTNVRSG